MVMKRRDFLKTMLIGCSAAAAPLWTPVTFAAMPGENRFVVIILRGAMDGLDLVQPYGDPALRALRPDLALGPEGGAADLNGFFALHPAVEALMPLWRAGELGFAHATATPYRDKRSHFVGQDLLEAGIAGNDPLAGGTRDGWLNRLLQTMPGADAETAYTIGSGRMLIMAGAAQTRAWAPEVNFGVSAQGRLLLDQIYHDDPLFRDAAIAAAAEAEASAMLDEIKGDNAARLASFAASRLNESARIASFSLTGWDTHANQAQAMPRAIEQLTSAILALKQGLGQNWAHTTVLAMTEFGRTARQNGSGGTDHGTGGAMLFAGGAIKGRQVIGGWPGLGEGNLYADRDLLPLRDIRAYAGWAMHGLFGVEASLIETTIFPGLELGPDPRLLA